VILHTYSLFYSAVKIFHLPNPYNVTASIHSSYTHSFREAGRVENSLGAFETNTIERLRNSQVKLGAAGYEDYAYSQRPMVNQMRTGTMSRHTLLNVLERSSEPLWVCPVCKYNNLQTYYTVNPTIHHSSIN
jgi:hypothetical protein